jgi:hypothetical protein
VKTTRARFQQFSAAMEAAEVDLAAFWVFDLTGQVTIWNVTFDNLRTCMLTMAAEADHRWNQAALKKEKH